MIEFFYGSFFLLHKGVRIHIKGDGHAGMALQFTDGLYIHSHFQGTGGKGMADGMEFPVLDMGYL